MNTVQAFSESPSSDGISSIRSGIYFPTTGASGGDSVSRFYDGNWWKLAEGAESEKGVCIQYTSEKFNFLFFGESCHEYDFF